MKKIYKKLAHKFADAAFGKQIDALFHLTKKGK